ncbi:HTH_48 domain-containing protein [Trichonephila clavipes]|nr:HTH_48 domain-containing protein [Trichonephila clavipes]
MRKICANVVSKVLFDDQTRCRKDVCVDMLEHIANEPNLLESVVMCDKTWVFIHDPESKRRSIRWKSPGSQDPKSMHVEITIQGNVFFDINEIEMIEWVLSGQTVNQHYYIDRLLHKDNALVRTTLSVKHFLTSKNISVGASSLFT